MTSPPLLSVTIVTFNSAPFISRCLDFVLEQDYAPLEVIVVDNASSDNTPEILRAWQDRVRVVLNRKNNGFAGGQNQAIALSRGAWVLTLNPDVRLTPSFLTQLLIAGESRPQIGSVSGKLLAMPPSFAIPVEPVLDSTGIYFTPTLRHFDRGSRQRDTGRFAQYEYVFGVTGAAAFYRRTMIEDVSVNGHFFDPDFFAYREDADLSWRAQLLGWKCAYTPEAVAYHVRSVLPTSRTSVAAVLNMHSVKNRFLMRIKNVTLALYARHFFAIIFRDLLIVFACLVRERSSLRAFWIVLQLLPRKLAERRDIMRLALLGTRGVPARYGGFETFAEEISARLVERGHQVTVYCRETLDAPEYRGIQLRYLPPIRHKYFETVAHTGLSTIDCLFRRFAVALYCNAATALFTMWPRLLGTPTALNVDGLERHRKKWNQLAKTWYLLSEWMATWSCSRVVTDAENIRDYYTQRYGKDSTFIPYGAETGKVQEMSTLAALGLEPGKYVLYVSRLEPENNALLVRQAFEKVRTDYKLALIGDAPYAPEYIRQVKDTRDPRILIPGAIYGDGYKQLQSHCAVYVQATEVGGTHPALVEAMGRGALVLYLNTAENSEAAGSDAIAFEACEEASAEDDLVKKLQWAVDLPAAERTVWGCRAMRRIEKLYSWNAVTDQYENLFRRLVSSS